MRRTLAVSLLALAIAPAGAAAAEPLPFTTMSPADGATFAPNTADIPFELSSPNQRMIVDVEVATQNVPDQDGSFLGEFTVDYFPLSRGDAAPGTYRGTSNSSSWSRTPRTYYWQASATEERVEDGKIVSYKYLGPVRTLTIKSPPPPVAPPATKPDLTMTPTDVRYYTKVFIRNKTRRAASGMRRQCSRRSYRSFGCTLSWRNRSLVYAGNAQYTHFNEGAEVFAQATFFGVRASIQCLRRLSVRQCSRPVRWSSG